MNAHTTSATPAKLRSGAWGARVQGTVAEGDVVTITTRAGKSWQARVTRVVWTGEGVAICATESIDRPSRPSSPSSPRTHGHSSGCSRCCYIPGRRTAQIWEDCEYCGAEPVYM